MIKNIKKIFLVTFFFLILCYFFYNYENTYFLKNNIFPFDSVVFKDMALNFFDGDYKTTIDYRNTLIYYPHNTKFIYPLLSGLIHKTLSFSLMESMMLVNLLCSYITIILSIFLINKFTQNLSVSILIIIFFLIIWNGPLRLTFYNPSNAFAFDTLLISSYTFAVFSLNQKNKFNLLIIVFLLIILSLQRYVVSVFLVIVPILINNIEKIEFKKFKLKNKFNLLLEDKIKLLILFLIYFIFSFNIEVPGSYSRLKFLIKFIYFHSNPFEFLYTYYYSYGSFFLILIFLISLKKFRQFLSNETNFLNREKKLFLLSVLIVSVILSTIGGDDSDRMLMWFFVWHLVIFSICFKFIFKNKYYFLMFIFLITHLFGSRILTQGIPNYVLSDTFLNYSQQTTTNFDDKYYWGPKFLKKYRNKMKIYKIETLPGIFIDNKSKIIETYLPHNKIKLDNSINIYANAYRYRLNDIPFPLGYIHNQRNALIDHPWHGKWWVRFLLLMQWLFLQVFTYIFLRLFKKQIYF
tara:strand:- start:503 stop:2062 length:1560 start_codon:yes stop_codon:yes gene_type:complete